jgi:hypothetical protein
MYDLYDPLFFLQGVECPCGDWSMGRHKPRPQLVGFCPCSESKVSRISFGSNFGCTFVGKIGISFFPEFLKSNFLFYGLYYYIIFYI